MSHQFTNLEYAHGDGVLIGRAVIKTLSGVIEIVVCSFNLLTVAENVLYDIPIPVFSWHRSTPPPV